MYRLNQFGIVLCGFTALLWKRKLPHGGRIIAPLNNLAGWRYKLYCLFITNSAGISVEYLLLGRESCILAVHFTRIPFYFLGSHVCNFNYHPLRVLSVCLKIHLEASQINEAAGMLSARRCLLYLYDVPAKRLDEFWRKPLKLWNTVEIYCRK